MQQEYIKIFTEEAIVVNRLRSLLEEVEIHVIIKDVVESARLAGFGSFTNTVELFVLQNDMDKATPIVTAFKKEINDIV